MYQVKQIRNRHTGIINDNRNPFKGMKPQKVKQIY